MSIISKLKDDKDLVFLSVIFYVIVGLVCLILLPLTNFPPHIGLIGIISLINAYGLVKNRFWVIWIVFILFFINTTFSVYTFYYYITSNLFVGFSAFIYLILTWFFTFYLNAKIKKND
jgi:hypothetical protein